MKRWQFWVGLAVSAVFMWWALNGLKLSDVWASVQHANYLWLIPSVAVYFVAVLARTWRWHYLLRPLKAVPLGRLFPVVVIGYMGNNIYPARIGELLRAYVLKRKEEVSISAALATVIIERIFDGVVMLGFVIFNLSTLAAISGESGFVGSIQQIAIVGTLAFAGALAAFLLAAIFPHQSLGLFHHWIEPCLPASIRAKITGIVVSFWAGLESLRSPFNILMVLVTSVAIWLLETVKYWFVMHAFSFQVSFFALMLMNGIVNLATTIPSAPGYLGTFDKPGSAVLAAFGVNPAVATGYTLVLHAALWLPITLLGVVYMMTEGVKWNDLQQAEQLRQARSDI